MGRLEKYKAKMNSDILKRRYDDGKKMAVANKAATVGREVEIELKVKGVCDGEPSMYHHYYMVYGKELVKNNTEAEWEITYNKWATRGLDTILLNNISELLVGWSPTIIPPPPVCLFDVGRFDVNVFG